MRKITTLLLGLLIATFASGKSVTIEQAKQVANKYLSANSLKSTWTVSNSFSKSYNGITTYYVFNYEGGGFIVVSADDAATPILAHSDEGYLETEIASPEARYWFENYSKEIAHIVTAQLDNSKSRAQWDNILNNNNNSKAPTLDVAPLLTTNWDQTVWYNKRCPTALGGPDNKAYVGCVATTMGQIMKYYNFPVSGIGSNSYSHGTFGTLSANFDTVYNFASMRSVASSSSYKAIASLLYRAGIAVNMDYAYDGSGAQTNSVPYALCNYFNYDNKTIGLAYMSDYTPADWQALLISELNAKHPLYYSGSDATAGHAWVCDGYQSKTGITQFHMNWGWSGYANGYFTIGALNSGNGDFNLDNTVVYGIKPGNPNLIIRFTDLDQTNLVAYGPTFNINCSVLKGTPTAVNLYIDKQLVLNTTQTTIAYPWNTLAAGIGAHNVRVEAIDANDTVSWQIQISLSEWAPEASGFSTPERAINYLHAVNPDVVWGTAIDGRSAGKTTTINEFTKTTNGGATWTPGKVIGGKVYGLGNICGINENLAFVSLFNGSAAQDNTCGVYKTTNGGTTWTHLVGALQGAASFADNVWFWDENNGMCHGDVTGTGSAAYFEIYTTTNGGTTWTRVPKTKIGGGVAAASGEGGWTSVIEAVGANTIMFGTNKGNLYISHDKGQNWTISNTGITPTASGGINKISFKDDMNGLVAQTSETLVLKETHDGGSTWQTITPAGPFHTSDMAYVPGTDNTWVSVGYGASFSFDGGHSWAGFPGTDTESFLSVDFLNNHAGWAGGFNTSATLKGMYKYIGTLDPSTVLNPISNLSAQPDNSSVQLTWTEPETIPLSYNIYRNDTLIGNTATLQYTDSPVAVGTQDYCITAVYSLGQSPKSCTTTFIALNIPKTDEAAYRIYPNPSSAMINIITPVRFNEVRMIDNLGKIVYRNNFKGTNLRILTEGFEPGMYIIQIYTGKQIISKKVSIIR